MNGVNSQPKSKPKSKEKKQKPKEEARPDESESLSRLKEIAMETFKKDVDFYLGELDIERFTQVLKNFKVDKPEELLEAQRVPFIKACKQILEERV